MDARRFAGSAALTLAVALCLSACGFSPLYSTAGYDRLAGLQVEAGPERFDYLVQDAVRDFAGPGSSPYTLTVRTTLTTRPLGVSPTGVATRIQLDGRAQWTLSGPDDSIAGGSAAAVSYDQARDPYAVIAATASAEDLLARQLAEQVIEDVAVMLRRRQAGLER